MRYLKRLLTAVYIYLALFAAACFGVFLLRGEEPAALIAGVCGAAGIESVVAALMKLREIAAQKKEKDEKDVEKKE